MAETNVGHDPYLGRTCTEKKSVTVSINDKVIVLSRKGGSEETNNIIDSVGDQILTSSVSVIFVIRGTSCTPLEPGIASDGDIVTIAGVSPHMNVGDTLTSESHSHRHHHRFPKKKVRTQANGTVNTTSPPLPSVTPPQLQSHDV